VLLASKTFAAMQGRDFVTPTMSKQLYARRSTATASCSNPKPKLKGLDADTVIRRLLNQVEVPR
jgi:hypothetical protein